MPTFNALHCFDFIIFAKQSKGKAVYGDQNKKLSTDQKLQKCCKHLPVFSALNGAIVKEC